MKRLILDFETRSECDLKKCGAYKYSLDPSTRPTCLAFKARGNPTVYFLEYHQIYRHWANMPEEFQNLWGGFIAEGYEFGAHNAFFETCIYHNILVRRLGWPNIPFRQFRCTAAKAAACALPRNLAGAGEAMNLPIQKDKRGYVAMMLTCKSTKEWNAWTNTRAKIKAGKKVNAKKIALASSAEPLRFLTPGTAPEVFKTLYEYCRIDVKTEELLDIALPDLHPLEQEVWFLNQTVNRRGLHIDIPTARKIVGIMEIESKAGLKELDTLTMGLVTKAGARQSILDFLKLEGIELEDIRAKTVEDVLKSTGISGDMRRLLEIRKALSKTSTKKYQAFLDRANEDDRVRDIILYHGGHTGRDSGTGIQPQNFCRPIIWMSKERPYAAIENVIAYDADILRLIYGDNLSIVFSSILRNMIKASEGCELFVADFSKIEVAVLWWLADNKPGLAILHAGKDPYKYMASANTGKRYEDIADDGNDRQLGKAQVLGCGFGMGWERFQETAHDQYRLKLSEEQSREAVNSYREANDAVCTTWKDYELAAIMAVEDKKTVTIGKCTFFCSGGFLWIELPSGRRLAYRSPTISWRETDYGPRKTLEYWAINSLTKKWSQHRTWGGKLTENIVQAVARDLLKHGELRLEKKGYRVLLPVHDEDICEKEKGKGSLEEFIKILCERPKWADAKLMIEAKGYVAERYRK